ncbi:MAG: FAD-binding protein [Promethearchaeota archaeon]
MTLDDIISTDVLVVGAGGAGIRAALEASKYSALDVTLIAKTLPGKSGCTVMAEGGYNAALCNVDPTDSVESHFQDTVSSAQGIANERLVRILVENAPARILELEENGALFYRDPNGKIDQRAFGRQSHKRTCYSGDRTGGEITSTLLDLLRASNIQFIEGAAVDLLLDKGKRIAGVAAFNHEGAKFFLIRSKAVILTTGGGCRIYSITTNSFQSTGDGFAIGYRAGAELIDMEFVQFHPTGMVFPDSAKGILVTEAVRAEGGILLNCLEERFMKKYAPDRMELAGRDVVSRAIYREIRAGRNTPHNGVYLSLKHLDPDFIEQRLPQTVEQFRDLAGVDITMEPMEVSPTAHHIMGGLRISERTETTLKGLFAAGEVTGGIHGANRLGGNALADLQVFGYMAGHNAAQYALESSLGKINDEQITQIHRVVISPLQPQNDGIRPFQIRHELEELMWTKVGILRTKENLTNALEDIQKLKSTPMGIVNQNTTYAYEQLEALQVRNMLTVAEIIIKAALFREESRGAHFREDFPETLPSWRKNIIISKESIYTVPVVVL